MGRRNYFSLVGNEGHMLVRTELFSRCSPFLRFHVSVQEFYLLSGNSCTSLYIKVPNIIRNSVECTIEYAESCGDVSGKHFRPGKAHSGLMSQ